MATPKLRFKEFDGDWLSAPLKKYFPKIRNGFVGVATPYYVEKGVKYLQGKNVKDGKIDPAGLIYISEEFHLRKNNSKLSIDDILMVQSGHVGECAVIEREYDNANCHALIVLSPHQEQKTNSHFVKYYFYTPLGKKIISQVKTGNTIEHVLASEIKEVELNFPSKEEQTKIASFLSAVDEKISQLTQKHALLSQYKQGMMQKLFSQQVRFKADDGSEFEEWEDKPLNEIASKRSGKNKDGSISEVLTNSATQGIIKQSDYFEREIVTESNLNGYYIVNLDDFVYNPRISVHAPVGPIKRNKKCLGVMSPLYTVFTVSEGNLVYLEYFFDSNFWHDYVKGVANSGARHDRMNITNKDFFDMPIFYPCLEEQTKIANFLSSIDQKIEVVAQQIEQAKTWKKGLLQQMFV